MSIFFDSPIAYCPVANRYVLLDQTEKCCAEEMGCKVHNCPLARYFAATSTPLPKEAEAQSADEQPSNCDELAFTP